MLDTQNRALDRLAAPFTRSAPLPPEPPPPFYVRGGLWLVSGASMRGPHPVQHFVFDRDGDAYCQRTSDLYRGSGRLCMFCLHYLMVDGFLVLTATGGGLSRHP